MHWRDQCIELRMKDRTALQVQDREPYKTSLYLSKIGIFRLRKKMDIVCIIWVWRVSRKRNTQTAIKMNNCKYVHRIPLCCLLNLYAFFSHFFHKKNLSSNCFRQLHSLHQSFAIKCAQIKKKDWLQCMKKWRRRTPWKWTCHVTIWKACSWELIKFLIDIIIFPLLIILRTPPCIFTSIWFGICCCFCCYLLALQCNCNFLEINKKKSGAHMRVLRSVIERKRDKKRRSISDSAL